MRGALDGCGSIAVVRRLTLLLLLAACSEPARHPSTTSVPTPVPASPTAPGTVPPADPAVAPVPSSVLTVRSLFCAYGGVGLVPVPLPPGYETNFVAHVIEIENPGPPIANVTVAAAALLDPSGHELVRLRRIDHFVDLTHAPPPDPSWGSFAVYLNPAGAPFTGTLPTGTTRLRVRYSIDSPGLSTPSHCRIELDGLPGAASVEGALDGTWPTS